MGWDTKAPAESIAAQFTQCVLAAIEANSTLSFTDPTVQNLTHPTVVAIIATAWHAFRMAENWVAATATDETQWPSPPTTTPAPVVTPQAKPVTPPAVPPAPTAA